MMKKFSVIVPSVVVLGGVIAAFTTLQVNQQAYGDGLKNVKSTQENFRPRIRKLETGQAGMRQKLRAIHEEQKAQTIRAATGRREILDAIKDLGNRIAR